MMNNNKILTVSYGTFSCTLEGFEDSFGTMKVIAEYFRDLAADDRYFGAEPPQPDADLMARIAEQDLARRVEAREQDGRIVLSAMDAAAVVAPAVIAAEARAAVPEPEEEETEEVLLDASAEEIEDAADVAVEEVAEDNEAVDAVTTEDVVEAIEEDAPAVEIAEIVTPVEEPAEVAVDDTFEAPEEAEVADVDDSAEDDILEEVAAVEVDDTPELEITEEVEAVEEPEAEPTAEDAEVEIVPGQPDAEVSAFFAETTDAPEDDTETVEDLIETPVASASQDLAPDSIAAKLQRIRAVVAKNETQAEAADYLEDEHAEAGDTEEPVLEAEMSQAEETVAETPDLAADAAEDSVAEDMVEDPDAPAMAEIEAEEDTAPEVIADARADIQDALDADDAQDILADMSEEASSEEDEALDAALEHLDSVASADAETNADEPSLEEALESAVMDEGAEDPLSNLFEGEDEVEVETPRRKSRIKTTMLEPITPDQDVDAAPVTKSRVVKVKRADLEAAIEKNAREQEARAQSRVEFEAADDESVDASLEAAAGSQAASELEEATAAKNDAASTLSAEDEAELARELAAVADEAAEAVAEATEDEKAEDQAFPTLDKDAVAEGAAQNDRKVSSRGLLPSLEEEGRGSAVSRLLAETDHQMDEPEGATRRDAFAHLRAAVAANKADSSIERAGKESDSPYREDLAEVVRPRKSVGEPVHEAEDASDDDEPRPAPLKLVAEQRIDAEAEASDEAAETATPEVEPAEAKAATAVAPRRVSKPLEPQAATAGTDEFVKFANEMGANSLPQLLEAAAAYMTFVEGREQFSRPQLMTKVRQAEGPDGFSREDGLRSFGQLLRAGKIEKLKGGRFTVSDDIGFRPDHRAAG